MPLVFAALVPHTPLLLPHIGKEKAKKLAPVRESVQSLVHELYLARVDTLVCISPHAGAHDAAFTMMGNDPLHARLSEFGDLQTYTPFANDLALVSAVREMTQQNNIPLALIPDDTLDYASAVSLLMLRQGTPKNVVAVIGSSLASRKAHYDFGYALKDLVHASARRYGVIVSSNFSHALSTDAPSGFSPQGAEFDAIIRKRLSDGNTSALLTLDETIATAAAQCALPALLMLMGMIERVHHTYKEWSYRAPFGVGYLTGQFLFR